MLTVIIALSIGAAQGAIEAPDTNALKAISPSAVVNMEAPVRPVLAGATVGAKLKPFARDDAMRERIKSTFPPPRPLRVPPAASRAYSIEKGAPPAPPAKPPTLALPKQPQALN